MNPQFHIQIPRSGAAKCHVVVSVTDKRNGHFNISWRRFQSCAKHLTIELRRLPVALIAKALSFEG